ncbi:hypothetical protein N8I77_002721 [Diaporthe amygdali]|uniref:Heterokaryon incompatibility domain-containing protein n=1 Tax=Phomopsis amygdali TaxID=1214568 RepID=A0AAD9STK0_PHOAM|nr:hypothetical protein N8I77_002721 [Diaporthe amygdali]
MERDTLCEKCRQIEFSALSTTTLADVYRARKDISRGVPLFLPQGTWRGPGEPPQVNKVNLGSLERIEHDSALGCKLCAVILDVVHRQGGFIAPGVALPRGDEVHFWADPSAYYGCITDSFEDIEWSSNNAYFVLKRLPFRLRLIDVNERCIRFFEEYDPSDSHTAFAALSYVWGLKPQKLLLTAEKEPMLTKPGAIGDNNVSQTIYDAIEVTKSLGLGYLWVDAICIRQGKTRKDERDKAEQIGNMAEIYRSAFLTIVAASGEDAEAGLAGLRPGTRSFPQQEIVVIPPDQDQPGLSLLSVCKRIPKHFGEFFDMRDEDADNSTWNTRGWTLQERALSRRNLIFTEEQVLWACDGAYFCEETAFEHPINETRHLSKENNPIRFELLNGSRLSAASLRSLDSKMAQILSSSKGFWNRYRLLVRNFSMRNLGFPGDIHDAFLGIMLAMQRIGNEHFHWGHPRSRFELSLSWSTFHTLSKRSAKTTLPMTSLNTHVDFPTWSWMGWVGEASVSVSDERLETETPTVLCFGHKSNPLRLTRIGGNNANEDMLEHLESQWLGGSTRSELSLDDISESLPELTQPRLQEVPDEHVLFFWASTAFFQAHMSEVEERQLATWSDYAAAKRPVIHDLKGVVVGERNFVSSATMRGLDSSLAEFIAVARRKIADLDLPATVLALQIRWVAGVAQRLNYAEIDEVAWEEASPTWKLIALM